MNRIPRYLLAIGLLPALVLFVAPRAAPAPAPAPPPQPGGTLVIVTHQKPAHLDPGVHTSRYTSMINQNTHDSLIWQHSTSGAMSGSTTARRSTPRRSSSPGTGSAIRRRALPVPRS